MNHATRHSHRVPMQRRAAALAGAVLVLTMINFAVLSAVVAGRDDSRVGAWRIEGMRAFLAAESGVHAYITETNAGRDAPDMSFTMPGGESVEITDVDFNQVTVRGRFGQAVRELTIEFE